MPSISTSLEHYLRDWGITIAASGLVCLLLGAFVGWIIWRNTRKFTERVETENREALADYERSSDEISRVKAEILAGND